VPWAARGVGPPDTETQQVNDLYRAKRLKLEELLTKTYPLEQVNEAYAALEHGEVARSVIVF